MGHRGHRGLRGLRAICQEWTGAASIAEAIRLHRAIRGHVESMQGLKVALALIRYFWICIYLI